LSRTYSGESHWALGYTPQLVIGVWLGQTDINSPLDPEIGPLALQNAAAGLWHAATQYAHQGLDYQTWEPPNGISLIEVCDPSGDLPTKNCPNTVAEVFLSGNEPVQGDTLYHAVSINADSGRLATVYTAPELIEERIYMKYPPEAAQWAQDAGLETPPQVYETLSTNLPLYEDAVVSQPNHFDLVRGRVDITGSVGGEGFQFYRVQVGRGLYPQEWLQIGQDVTQATTGQLASWDTDDLNGLHSIQLLVARQDQSVERVNLLVTVDNKPPEVHIVAPLDGAAIDGHSSKKIVLRAEAEDEIGIQSVVFYLNDEPLQTRIQPPFAFSWQLEPGEHRLRVVATDQAGNTSDDAITFVVE
jgi:membrane carboxypeptidase/penicillin-binding protein PbpC